MFRSKENRPRELPGNIVTHPTATRGQNALKKQNADVFMLIGQQLKEDYTFPVHGLA